MKSAAQKQLKSHVIRRGNCGLEVTESLVYYWFHIINKAAFKDQVNRPIVVVRGMRGYSGWCRIKLVGPTIELASKAKNRKTFIATVAHEMVHLWQWQNEYELDHGQNFTYWKRHFKKQFGLIL